MIHGLADLALGRGRDALASIERAVNGGFEGGQRHRNFLGRWGSCSGERGFVRIWPGRVKAASGVITREGG